MSTYVCNRCEREFEKRAALCFYCRTDSLYEKSSEQTVSEAGSGVVRASDAPTGERVRRLKTPFESLNEALHGGFIFPSIVRLGGPPGAGKSTLALQCLSPYAKRGLYVTGEETSSAVFDRARRTHFRHIDDLAVFCHDNPEAIQEKIIEEDPDFVVADSGGVFHWHDSDFMGPTLEAEVVRDMAYFTKKMHQYAGRPGRTFTMLILSHVIKSGDMAGMMATQHDVDMTLLMNQNPPIEDDSLEINPKPLSKEELLRREIYTQLRTIQVKKTRGGGAPIVSPRFLLKGDGLHEYQRSR